VRVEP